MLFNSAKRRPESLVENCCIKMSQRVEAKMEELLERIIWLLTVFISVLKMKFEK